MLAPWVIDEMRTADLKDKRLDERLREVLSQLAERPTASIPAACGGYAETAAAYRFFDNEKVNFDNVLQPHLDATRRRIAEQKIVLLVQDTTEVDLTRPEQQVMGAGPLDGNSRRGALLHLMHAFTPDGTPLGTVSAASWVRDDEAPRTGSLSHAQRGSKPIEEKESYRWVVALRQAREEALHQPQTRVVCVADSEADIYEVLAEGMAEPQSVDWIVRAAQNRALRLEDDADVSADCVREQVLTKPILFTQTIKVRGRKAKTSCEDRGRRQPRESRTAEVEVRACRVTLVLPGGATVNYPRSLSMSCWSAK